MRCCREESKGEQEGQRSRALQNGFSSKNCTVPLLSLGAKGASGKFWEVPPNCGKTTAGNWQQRQGQPIHRVLLVPQGCSRLLCQPLSHMVQVSFLKEKTQSAQLCGGFKGAPDPRTEHLLHTRPVQVTGMQH